MPLGGRPVARAQQLEEVVEAAAYLLHRHGAHPGRGQLDRQRKPVEAGHDVGYCVGRELGVGAGGPGPLHEQSRGVIGGQLS